MKIGTGYRFFCTLGGVLGLSSGVASAQSDQGEVSLTIYNNDQALIQDTRQLNLPGGRSRQEFPGVSATIRPETVTLSASGATIVEQNFDYDLLTPAALMDKAVGQTVTVVRTNPATGAETTETAQILANNQGTLLRIGNRIEVLQGYGGRIVFADLPKNLRAQPTLSVTLDTKNGGARPATLNYLSRGFGWKADYVALFDEKSGKLDMQGWITLTNNSGTSFPNAQVYLVAGSPGGNGNDNGYQRYNNYSPDRRVSGNRPGTESARRERLGDYYVYPIAGRTTVAAAQQKQASFLDVSGTSASKGYFFRNNWMGQLDDPVSFDTVLRFSTSANGGLGDALPAGTVRVYMRDARGQPQFIGENAIGHTPMGSQVAIKTGEAFDVKVLPTVEKREKITSAEWEQSGHYRIKVDGRPWVEVVREDTKVFWRTSMAYRITNAKPTPVTVEVVQAGLDDRWRSETRIPSESVKGEQRSLDERAWLVDVPANGETTLRVQFDTRY